MTAPKLSFSALENQLTQLNESNYTISKNLPSETLELIEERRRGFILGIQNGQMRSEAAENAMTLRMKELELTNLKTKEAGLWAREAESLATKLSEEETRKDREISLKDDVINELRSRLKAAETSSVQALDLALMGKASLEEMVKTQLQLNSTLQAENDTLKHRLSNRAGPPKSRKNPTTAS